MHTLPLPPSMRRTRRLAGRTSDAPSSLRTRHCCSSGRLSSAPTWLACASCSRRSSRGKRRLFAARRERQGAPARRLGGRGAPLDEQYRSSTASTSRTTERRTGATRLAHRGDVRDLGSWGRTGVDGAASKLVAGRLVAYGRQRAERRAEILREAGSQLIESLGALGMAEPEALGPADLDDASLRKENIGYRCCRRAAHQPKLCEVCEVTTTTADDVHDVPSESDRAHAANLHSGGVAGKPTPRPPMGGSAYRHPHTTHRTSPRSTRIRSTRRDARVCTAGHGGATPPRPTDERSPTKSDAATAAPQGGGAVDWSKSPRASRWASAAATRPALRGRRPRGERLPACSRRDRCRRGRPPQPAQRSTQPTRPSSSPHGACHATCPMRPPLRRQHGRCGRRARGRCATSGSSGQRCAVETPSPTAQSTRHRPRA